jgi:hypothetical protein
MNTKNLKALLMVLAITVSILFQSLFDARTYMAMLGVFGILIFVEKITALSVVCFAFAFVFIALQPEFYPPSTLYIPVAALAFFVARRAAKHYLYKTTYRKLAIIFCGLFSLVSIAAIIIVHSLTHFDLAILLACITIASINSSTLLFNEETTCNHCK